MFLILLLRFVHLFLEIKQHSVASTIELTEISGSVCSLLLVTVLYTVPMHPIVPLMHINIGIWLIFRIRWQLKPFIQS